MIGGVVLLMTRKKPMQKILHSCFFLFKHFFLVPSTEHIIVVPSVYKVLGTSASFPIQKCSKSPKANIGT